MEKKGKHMAKTYSNRTRDKQEVKAITDQLEEGLKELLQMRRSTCINVRCSFFV